MMREPLPIIRLNEGDAVAFPAAFGDNFLRRCSRSTLGEAASYWTPVESEIKQSEAIFAAYRGSSRPTDRLLQRWPDLRLYHRQYIGVVRDGKMSIYSSFLPAGGPGEKDWRQRP